MYDIFDVIDSLQDLRRISGRKLADRAGMRPTTFASMMSRRPATIPMGYLKAIASALDVKWNEILNVPESAYQEKADDEKIPTTLSERDHNEVMIRFFGSTCEPYVLHVQRPDTSANVQCEEPSVVMDSEQVYRDQYKKAICYMLDTLNSNGLRNVMQHILELNIDPEFSTKNTKNNQEDNG